VITTSAYPRTIMAAGYSLFVMGNPLLDIQVRNGEKLLEKYGLKANDAILAEDKHQPLYEELVREHEITYVAGGAAQNTARGAAYLLPPNSVVYTGAVGDDKFAEQLKTANKREGLVEVYEVKEGEKTGACAVIITGHHRSLVTTLCVAEKFSTSHLSSSKVAPLIENAKYFYMEGYFLTHGVPAAMELSKRAAVAGKTFAVNISAPFIAQFFKKQLDDVLFQTDILFGNESEAEAYATAAGYPEPKNIADIARRIALLPKRSPTRPRVVIFTRGAESTILVSSEQPDQPQTFPVDKLDDSQIVDTNGAGDAFAGGVLAALVAGKDFGKAVLAGHALAQASIRQVGPQFPWPKIDIL